MIARYDGRSGRWSATGLAVSLLIAGVAFTGAVNGQDAAASGQPAAQPAAAPEKGSDARFGARPQSDADDADLEEKPWNEKYRKKIIIVDGREVNRDAVDREFLAEVEQIKKAKPNGDPGAPDEPFDEAAYEKLWKKYADKLLSINGREINRDAVDREFLAEARRRAGSDERLRQLVDRNAGGGGREPTPGPVKDEDVDAELLAQLDKTLPEVSFDGAALSDVVDFLRDVSGANLVVEWRRLEDAGIDRNAPVSLRVKNVKFARALDLVLSGAASGVRLGYSLDGNIIRVSTGDHLDTVTDVRAYDVRDILASESKMEDLTKLITEAVAPDSWRAGGGSVGVILPTRNKLVVTQTPMNHRQIRSVLRMLRDQPREPARTADAASAAHAPPPAQPLRR